MGKEFSECYLFVRQLRSQVKHPIILNYKAQLVHIAKLLNLSDYKLRKLLNTCLRLGLAQIQGKHIKLHSNNMDWNFKPSKKNDYRVTSDPIKFRNLVLFRNHYNKQLAEIKKKQRQTHERVNKGVKANQDQANPTITASIRSVANMFHTKSIRTAQAILDQMKKEGLIEIAQRRHQISKIDCVKLLKQNKRNIRKVNGLYYSVDYELILKYSLKRERYQPFYKLSEQQQATFLEMGYTIEDINRMLS